MNNMGIYEQLWLRRHGVRDGTGHVAVLGTGDRRHRDAAEACAWFRDAG